MNTIPEGLEGLEEEFLEALGAAGHHASRELLRRELDELALPGARAVARLARDVDVLIEFLASTGLAAQLSAVRELREWLRDGLLGDEDQVGAAGPLRREAARRIEAAFGVQAESLAARLTGLVEVVARGGRALDTTVAADRYDEVKHLCESWDFALDDEYAEGEPRWPRSYPHDELFSLQRAVHGAVSTLDDGFDWAEASSLVRQIGELVALDMTGRVNWLSGAATRTPALGWPALWAQASYRVRQLAAEAMAGNAPVLAIEPVGTAQPQPFTEAFAPYRAALRLLDAYQGRWEDITGEEPGLGFQRICRSARPLMPHLELFQLSELRHELRVGGVDPADLVARYGLASVDELSTLLGLLRRHLVMRVDPQRHHTLADPRDLPYSGWELRETYPELVRLLAVYRAQWEHGAPRGGELHGSEALVSAVCGAYTARVGVSSRAVCGLVGEIAGLDVLLPHDDGLHQALTLLGAGPPRQECGQVPDWDELVWRSWLREASADLMLRIRADREGCCHVASP